MDAEQTACEALVHVANGNARAASGLRLFDHAVLLTCSSEAKPVLVTRDATISVLRGLQSGHVRPHEAQAWASFVRRGYVEGPELVGPVRPIPIDYEPAWEDAIAEAVSRVDQIGDLIDGEVSSSELHQLLLLLGVVD